MNTGFRFLVLASAFSKAMAACSSATCHHGSCSNDRCVCEGSYTGPDCSIPTQLCPDGDRTCYNGSECVQNNVKDRTTMTYKYHCDCSKAYGVSSFAGIQCEYSSTTVCETGKLSSMYAFCTNGGQCIKTVNKGEAHAGCQCPSDFEGSHCQYLLGTAPASDLAPIYVEKGTNLSGITTFFTVTICIGLVSMFVFILVLKREREEREKLGFPADEGEAADFEGANQQQLPDVI